MLGETSLCRRQEADKGLLAGKHAQNYYAFSLSFYLSFMTFPVNAVKMQ